MHDMQNFEKCLSLERKRHSGSMDEGGRGWCGGQRSPYFPPGAMLKAGCLVVAFCWLVWWFLVFFAFPFFGNLEENTRDEKGKREKGIISS